MISDSVKYYLGIFGEMVGVSIMISPAVYDVLMQGVRAGERIKVCGWGVVIMFVGFGLYLLGSYCKNTWGKR